MLELCYAVIFPSHLRSEAYGMTLLEAAMYGKPMISCEIGTGTTFINLDGNTGLAVNPEDPISLRSAIIQLWDHPSQAGTMGDKAKERFDSLFTAERMVDSYMQLYQRLLQSAQ